MSTSTTKGPAYEIRFCEGNKVQVFDLSKRKHKAGDQLLPNEYLEEDVINGRLRYSKLGNQWLSDDADRKHQQQLASIPDEPSAIPTTRKQDDALDVIPVLAKQKAIEDAKELESIRQGEEAMRKAMERKKKIEKARQARLKAQAQAEEAAHNENNDSKNHHEYQVQDCNSTSTTDNAAVTIIKEHDSPYQIREQQKQQRQQEQVNSMMETNYQADTKQKLNLASHDYPGTPLPSRQSTSSHTGAHSKQSSISSSQSPVMTVDTHENQSQITSVSHESFSHESSPAALRSSLASSQQAPPPRSSSSVTQHQLTQPDPVYTQEHYQQSYRMSPTPSQSQDHHHQPQQQQQQKRQQHQYHYACQPDQQSAVNHYQPTHRPTVQMNQINQSPDENSFFHQDNISDKKKQSSSTCCCIIS